MVDFDVIIIMNWLSLYQAIPDCYAKIMTIGPLWKGVLHSGRKKVISFLHAYRLVERGYFSYLFHICGTNIALPPPLDSIYIVYDLIDIFPINFLGIPLNRDMDFAIDI